MRKHTRKGLPPQKNKTLQDAVMAKLMAREAAAKREWEEKHPQPTPVIDLNSLKEIEIANSQPEE